MSLCSIATNSSAASALALALLLASPAAAAEEGHDMPGHAAHVSTAPAMPPPGPGLPDSRPMSGEHDMRPVWQGPAGEAMMPDARTRDAWLRECHRRTEYYYDGGHDGWGNRHHRRRRGNHHADAPGYSYCEAYFDDYYRTYAQRGYAHAHAMPMMAHPRPMMMAQASQPCEEVVTTEYVPVRSRFIPRRPARRAAPDKRIRVMPDKRQRLD